MSHRCLSCTQRPPLPLHPAAPACSRLYEKLLRVAERGHQKAMEKVAYAMLFGDYMNQNVTKARQMFERLAVEGSPKAQMVLSRSLSLHFN